MNFFEAQDNARRKTWQLLLLFGAAVLSLILLTNVLVATVVFYSNTMAFSGSASNRAFLKLSFFRSAASATP